MADEQTVTLTTQEWAQLVSIIANGTGYLTIQKLFQQLQAQTPQSQVVPQGMTQPGDGLDLAPPEHVRRPRN